MGRRPERGLQGSLGGLAALLAASILISGLLPTKAQDRYSYIPITWEPSDPYIGGNITLKPGGKPGFGFCIWNRRYSSIGNWIFIYFPPPHPNQNNGPGYTGREMGDPKCSLHIRNLMRQDAGHYEIRKIGDRFVTEVGETTLKFSGRHNLGKALIAGSVVAAVVGAILIGILLYYGFRESLHSGNTLERIKVFSAPICTSKHANGLKLSTSAGIEFLRSSSHRPY